MKLSPRDLKGIREVLLAIAPKFKDLKERMDLATIGIACRNEYEKFEQTISKVDNENLVEANKVAKEKYEKSKEKDAIDVYLSDLDKIDQKFKADKILFEEINKTNTTSFTESIEIDGIPELPIAYVKKAIDDESINQFELETLMPIIKE